MREILYKFGKYLDYVGTHLITAFLGRRPRAQLGPFELSFCQAAYMPLKLLDIRLKIFIFLFSVVRYRLSS